MDGSESSDKAIATLEATLGEELSVSLRRYLDEAIGTFYDDRRLSSSFMLGAVGEIAVEMAVTWLESNTAVQRPDRLSEEKLINWAIAQLEALQKAEETRGSTIRPFTP